MNKHERVAATPGAVLPLWTWDGPYSGIHGTVYGDVLVSREARLRQVQ